MGYQGLPDDADAFADLGSTAACELFVEDVLVDAFAVGSAVFFGPGDSQPAFASELFHEGSAFRRINDLCHVLTAYVEDLRVVVDVKEFGHFGGEGVLFRGELKVHLRCCKLAASVPLIRSCLLRCSVVGVILWRGWSARPIRVAVSSDDPAGSQVTEFGSADVKFASEHFASVLA